MAEGLRTEESGMTPEEIFETISGVEKLYVFQKEHPLKFFRFARGNGKTRMAYQFIKEFSAIIAAYERAEKKLNRKRRCKNAST